MQRSQNADEAEKLGWMIEEGRTGKDNRTVQ
jgi:hypothetical protein